MLEGLQRIPAIKAEITNDPLSRGYSGMTAAEITASLNTANIAGPEKTSVSGAEIYNAIVPSEWSALNATQQQYVRDIFSLGDAIDVSSGTNTRTVLLSIFGAGTTTRTNLAELVATQISRAEQLDLGTVEGSEVYEALQP